jgi:hypothetical protein
MDLGEIGWDGVDWLVWLRIGARCELGNETSGFMKFWKSTEWLHN